MLARRARAASLPPLVGSCIRRIIRQGLPPDDAGPSVIPHSQPNGPHRGRCGNGGDCSTPNGAPFEQSRSAARSEIPERPDRIVTEPHPGFQPLQFSANGKLLQQSPPKPRKLAIEPAPASPPIAAGGEQRISQSFLGVGHPLGAAGSGQIQRRPAAGLSDDISYGGLIQEQPCFRHAHRHDAYPRRPILRHLTHRRLDFPVSRLRAGLVGIPVYEQQVGNTRRLQPLPYLVRNPPAVTPRFAIGFRLITFNQQALDMVYQGFVGRTFADEQEPHRSAPEPPTPQR